MAAASILVVEDEQIVSLDIESQLVDMGYTVAGSAASAEEAIRLASSAGPTLILMDIMLQGIMDGTDAAKIISRHLQIPIVFVTAYSDIKTVERAAGSAPYGFLTKPFQPRELRAAIEVALYKSQMERHLRDSERWFATALRCVGDAVIATNANAEITFLNPVAEQLVGWTLDEARGHRIDEVMRLDAPFGEHGLIANPIFTALRDNEVIATKYGAQLVRRDGSMIPIDDSAAPIRDDDNAVLGAVLVARDVSLRLKQEADLRASEERFRSTFEARRFRHGAGCAGRPFPDGQPIVWRTARLPHRRAARAQAHRSHGRGRPPARTGRAVRNHERSQTCGSDRETVSAPRSQTGGMDAGEYFRAS